MIRFVIEIICFQLLFLLSYDVFLRKETFFVWNRVYLLLTPILAIALPAIQINTLKTTLPELPETLGSYAGFPIEVITKPALPIVVEDSLIKTTTIPIEYLIFGAGAFLAVILFLAKLHRLQQFKVEGDIHYFKNFTRVVLKHSTVAFSFLRTIFLGDQVLEQKAEYDTIVRHELVHIRQKHSWDLLFFELLRIVFWFNPLIYIYQARISELHEYIVDANLKMEGKQAQYQLLLSKIFETQNVSFVNRFFKSSLLKKRIVMLQKTKSKRIWQLKYLLLVPLIMSMLFYTSCERELIEENSTESSLDDATLNAILNEKVAKDLKANTSNTTLYFRSYVTEKFDSKEILSKEEFFEYKILWKMQYLEFARNLASKSPSFKDFFLKIENQPPPSTASYIDYVNKKKVFQILDENLRISIGANIIELIDRKSVDTSSADSFEVINTTNLTGLEVRALNNRIDTTFDVTNDPRPIVLFDDDYAFVIKPSEANKFLN